ncbi:hypothetical protein ACHAW6_006329 [Cyclotella cf. meneghiniana]
MNSWLPQASYPWGLMGHGFLDCIGTEHQNQVSCYPFVLHEISVLVELTFGHLHNCLTDVPPQPNSPPDIASLDDKAFGYHKRVMVTPTIYPSLVEFLHFDIQIAGQKSHCANTISSHCNALF